MKKILVVGKLNSVVQSLNESLAEKFHVQVCPDSLDLIKDMMGFLKPDIVLLNIVGWEQVNAEIFDLFRNSYLNMPVLVIETKSSREKYGRFYESDRFLYMESPISKKHLMERCCKLLHMELLEEETSAAKLPGNKGSAPKRQILVVDDSPIVLRSIKAMLDPFYTVAVATSGAQALKLIDKKRPDLILLDYEMPGWDGKRTLELIRKNEKTQNIPVIFLTGVADKAHIVAVLSLKPERYLLKPPESEKLLDAIEEVFARQM